MSQHQQHQKMVAMMNGCQLYKHERRKPRRNEIKHFITQKNENLFEAKRNSSI